MPNSSYLCSTDLRSLYPSTTDRGFDPAKGVVAFDVRCVPLLWLAMFRPADLSTQAVTVEPDPDAVFFAFDEGGGDLVEAEAPRRRPRRRSSRRPRRSSPRTARSPSSTPPSRCSAGSSPPKASSTSMRRCCAGRPPPPRART
ncbi:hypothetical protein LO763_13555 [Glycomyces sp. A-F 0318]|uniref:hypothetical protein n=1 Tax=Glycomyces amatae TaxID=2881355 RepID=UPI001E322924|nr:hypothetical protein [Glycomyces amatae]MCD0444649.1 hypothetical protein [Glycomyces amatae]